MCTSSHVIPSLLIFRFNEWWPCVVKHIDWAKHTQAMCTDTRGLEKKRFRLSYDVVASSFQTQWANTLWLLMSLQGHTGGHGNKTCQLHTGLFDKL